MTRTGYMLANCARIQVGSSYAKRTALVAQLVGMQARSLRFATRADLVKIDSGDEFHM